MVGSSFQQFPIHPSIQQFPVHPSSSVGVPSGYYSSGSPVQQPPQYHSSHPVAMQAVPICVQVHLLNIGNTTFPTKSHTFQLNSVLHVPKLSQDLLSIYELCKDNTCRCIVDEFSICIQDKVTGRVLYHGLSNNAVYPILVFKSSKSPVPTPVAFFK
ncbi:hypothetical protein ACFX14_032346 [Malus domestica]